jgi:PHD/YefM family antitoxin component YafN of YafNO toxin-antitoxin module
LVLTQHGKSAAVVLDVDGYEALIEQVELIHDFGTLGLSWLVARASPTTGS